MKARILTLVLITVVIAGGLVYLFRDYLIPKPAGQNWRTGPGTARQPPSGLVKNVTALPNISPRWFWSLMAGTGLEISL